MPPRYLLCILSFLTIARAADQARVSFNRDIRPIMSDTCFRCHGPDKSSRMAGLRLDLREEALKPLTDGSVPIVPGDPEKSAIVQRVFSAPGKRMPPQYAHKDLTGKQKQTIRDWVAQGAVYEGHWAYSAVVRPTVPSVASAIAPGGNPIDLFIQDRLAKEGLTPSPEADRRTLIRRVTIDLTGLLPTPAEVLAFERDRAANAYEKVVDRLLASPRYAEQRTMHWLDAVRYADTCGFHGDNLFPAWPYRDYVLHAFRENKPFDEFTREQLAGDLLPNASLDQKVASAYNRLNRTSAEGGLQPDEYLAKYGADRVRSVSVAWLGSTMGCAECHDHKFDPFLTKDFYSMKAFFADIKETGLVPDRGERAWGTQVELPTPEQQRRRDQLDRELAAAQKDLESASQGKAALLETEKELLARWKGGELAWRFQYPEAASSVNGSTVKIAEVAPSGDASHAEKKPPARGTVLASGKDPDNETYLVTLRPGGGSWTALGLDVEQDDSLPGNGISRGADRFVLTRAEAYIQEPGKPERKLRFSLATGDSSTQNGMPATAVLDGDSQTGWGVALGESTAPFLALRFSEKLETGPDTRIKVRLEQNSLDYRRAVIGRFRLALSSAEYSWPGEGLAANRSKYQKLAKSWAKDRDLAIWAGGLSLPVLRALQDVTGEKDEEEVPAETNAKEPEPKRTEKERKADAKALAEFLQWTDPQLSALEARADRLSAERNILQASIARVVTTTSADPRETRILPRGNWMDSSGAVVEPAIPERFGKLDTGGKRATRLDLANWIASKNNPLTARAFVNRTWREFFGTGISKTLDDLGSQGEWPVHPELLDWLASEFMHPEWEAAGTHDWDVKHLVRTIVLSHTYRQSSLPVPDADRKDPENRLLARQSRYRVDAENVRDIALEVSGLLAEKFGGPSVRPYQPDGYLATLNFPKREYSASRGDDLYRRGLYTQWRRTFLHPEMLNFDAPTREECTVNRTTSNTPLQALDLLNDPAFVEAARMFAQIAIQRGGATVDQRVDWIFHQALDRSPTAAERRILETLYNTNLERFTAAPDDAKALISTGEAPLAARERTAQTAAMTMVARAVLNLHETITRN